MRGGAARLSTLTGQTIDGNNLLIGVFGGDTNGGNLGQAYRFSAAATVPEPTTLTLFGAARAGPARVVR
ncbi:MAG: hypothetical protein V3T62_11965 [Alphaproteobacteria bacterium]